MAELSGSDWASIIESGVELTQAGVSAGMASKTNCGQICRQKCKAETGWLFSGRKKCKKACKADCVAQQNEQKTTPPPNKTALIVITIVVIAIIGVILWWMFRKK